MLNNAAVKTFQELKKLNVMKPFDYFDELSVFLYSTSVTGRSVAELDITTSAPINMIQAIDSVVTYLLKNNAGGRKVMAIGNGGSAAIAIHTLVDYANAGGLKTIDFNSPAMLTCMANDYGYENVFAKPVELFADEGDILFAVSSSGKSPNITKACAVANNKNCHVITFSGFSPDNPLRKLGRINFYVPSTHYGFVELAHQVLMHCILDLFLFKKVQN